MIDHRVEGTNNLSSTDGIAQQMVVEIAEQEEVSCVPRTSSPYLVAVVSFHDLSPVLVQVSIT